MKKTIYLFLLGSISLISFEGCKKDSGANEIISQVSSLEKIKFQKIEKFISVMWVVPAEEIKYNEDLKNIHF